MTLKKKSILACLLIPFFLIAIVNPGYSIDDTLTSVNDVGSIGVSAYKKNPSTLYVTFFYKSHKTDRLVFWQGVSSEVSCDVYELVGNRFDNKQGHHLGEIKQHRLSSYNQGVYIEVNTTGEKWGLVECGWTFGGIKFYGKKEFLQH